MEYFDQVLEYFDQVLESLVCDGKFWFNFPGHGYQNFISKTWSFPDFFSNTWFPPYLYSSSSIWSKYMDKLYFSFLCFNSPAPSLDIHNTIFYLFSCLSRKLFSMNSQIIFGVCNSLNNKSTVIMSNAAQQFWGGD